MRCLKSEFQKRVVSGELAAWVSCWEWVAEMKWRPCSLSEEVRELKGKGVEN